MKKTHWLLAIGGALALAACGSSDGTNPPPPDSGTPTVPTIEISGFAYSPSALTVDAGTVITVKNLDGTAHSVTSETAVGDFTPGAVAGVSFDTGHIPGGQNSSVTIPGTAASGTVIPYYCTVHGNMMPQGSITVH